MSSPSTEKKIYVVEILADGVSSQLSPPRRVGFDLGTLNAWIN
jgi:hypothetical protein